MSFPNVASAPRPPHEPGKVDDDRTGSLALANMSPANFGLVMATGILSIAAHLLAHPGIAHALFHLNKLQFVILWALTAWRALRHPDKFFGDMGDHLRGPGFFTTVAASALLGGQYIVLDAQYAFGWALWGLALACWVVLTYAVFCLLTIRRSKPTLDRGINGGWLLAVVATQSIAVSSSLLAAAAPPYRPVLDFLALSMWLWGGMLYIWLMALIFYRYTFFPLSVADLTPPYWINMGAMAISTLAGSLLIRNAAVAPDLQALLPFLKGFTLLYWAAGTWWIPLLILLGIWRYVAQRYPLRYDPMYWAAVFPLGMYSVCTWQMNRVMDFGFLGDVPVLFFYAACAAWVLAFSGLVMKLARHALLRWRH